MYHTWNIFQHDGPNHLELWLNQDIVWPCRGGPAAGLSCMEAGGEGMSPAAKAAAQAGALMAEGLAPTFRSGTPPRERERDRGTPSGATEDLGFWWAHGPRNGDTDTVARNGNPKPCGQGTCNPRDWASNVWAPDLELTHTFWSTAGHYRGGGAIGFDGKQSRAQLAENSNGHRWAAGLHDQLTIGMVVHPAASSKTKKQMADAEEPDEMLWARRGVFELALDGDRRLRWTVFLDDKRNVTVLGPPLCPRPCTAPPIAGFAVKATFDGSAADGQAKAQLFTSGNLLATAAVSPAGALAKPMLQGTAMTVGARQRLDKTSEATASSWDLHFNGSIEELYIKNVSTASRRGAYVFADDCRSEGTFLIDLATAAGRKFFASSIQAVLQQATFSDVQFDGFEKLQLISRVDFEHSNKTMDSGLYKGHTTPGHYHLPWPLRVGQGILQGISETHELIPPATAVELSFMASGLGPYRPDMNTYVDEKLQYRSNASTNTSEPPEGFVLLGLQWHAKLAQRTELTGMAINAYDCKVDLAHSATELDYWLGGLITTGVGPQPVMTSARPGPYDPLVSAWMRRFRRYGHLQEQAIQTLYYDPDCCHVQGVCQWVACADVVAVGLADGENPEVDGTVLGLYVAASGRPIVLPADSAYLPAPAAANATATVLLFLAQGVNATTISLGALAAATPTLRRLRLVPLSPLESNATIALGGAWWNLHNENVRLTVEVEASAAGAAGTVVSDKMLWPGPQTGQHEWSGALAGWAPGAAAGLRRPTLVFEKV